MKLKLPSSSPSSSTSTSTSILGVWMYLNIVVLTTVVICNHLIEDVNAFGIMPLSTFSTSPSRCIIPPSSRFNTERTSSTSSSFPSSSSSVPTKRDMRLYSTTKKNNLPDISDMKASEMKKELESYGIPTKSLFEKSEFADAVKKAREEGKQPIKANNDDVGNQKNDTKKEKKDKKKKNKSKNKNDDDDVNGAAAETRQERYEKAMEVGKKMKVKELKQELIDRGISTKSFFEKSEFVKSYAEAVADNIQKGSTNNGGTQYREAKEEESYDPSYRDVVMQKIDRRQLAGDTVIDVSI